MADAVEQRPRTVLIVAAFLLAATAIAAVVGISLLFPNRLLDRIWELNPADGAAFHALGRISGVLLSALGLLRRKLRAWWFAVGLSTTTTRRRRKACPRPQEARGRPA